MAWLVIYFYLYYMETLGSLNFSVRLHFFNPITLYREGKTILILHIAFADGGNQTRAACTASKCTIHYSIASRHLSPWYLVDSMGAPSWWCSFMVVFVDRDKSHVKIAIVGCAPTANLCRNFWTGLKPPNYFAKKLFTTNCFPECKCHT